MSQLVEQYDNLSCLMYSLEKQNANNSNTNLLQVSEWIEIDTYIQIPDSGSRFEIAKFTKTMEAPPTRSYKNNKGWTLFPHL